VLEGRHGTRGSDVGGVKEGVAVEQPFEDFFEQEQDRLLRVPWIVTGSLQEAEDIVQDAFLRVRDAEVRRAGLEPATRCLEGSRSVQTELPALDSHVCRPRLSHTGYSAAAKG
jgi:hypothetical protein